MAVARAQGQGGFTAIHAWLIVFVALWLTSTVLLVILYLDQEKHVKAAEDIRVELAKVIGSPGKGLPQWAESRAGSGTTMVDLVEAARGQTAALITGSAADQPGALRQRLDSLVQTIASDPHVAGSNAPFRASTYAEVVDDLFARLRASAAARNEAEQGVASLTREMEALRGTQTGQKDEFVAQAEALRQEIMELRASYDRAREQHIAQVAKFEADNAAMQKQCSDDIQQQRERTADLREDYDELYARYEQLQGKLGQAQVSAVPLATARTGDGRVLDAKPGENIVYIDLGARDQLTLGLEFAVYDAMTGIPEHGRPKARIQVSNIFPSVALCHVKEQFTNEPVTVDDIIANPVYDRHRTLKYFVLGEFDLNGDGRADVDGRQRIEAQIENWGGAVEPRLNAQVDFVVLGGAPATPRRSPQLTEAEDTQYQAEKKAHDRYHELLASVRALAIPPLTQSVFLNFMGSTRLPDAPPIRSIASP